MGIMSSRPLIVLPCLFVVFVSAACNRNPTIKTVPVTGTITYQGQPVEGAFVGFLCRADTPQKSAGGQTDAQGRFTLVTLHGSSFQAGAMEGSYKVTVATASKSNAAPGISPPPGTDPNSIDMDAMRAAMASSAMTGPPQNSAAERDPTAQPSAMLAQAEAGNTLPKQYASPKTTTLQATVEEGNKNDFTFVLEEQKEPENPEEPKEE
jgi:hypothetical protein